MRIVGGSKARACSRPGTRLRLFWRGASRGVGEEKCEVPSNSGIRWRSSPASPGPCPPAGLSALT